MHKIRLKDFLKKDLDSNRTTVVPQISLSHVAKEIGKYVVRMTNRSSDAVILMEYINGILVYSAVNGIRDAYMRASRYIKISSKFIAMKLGISESRVESARVLLRKMGLIKFLPSFKRGSTWQNVWEVSVHADSSHVENKIVEFRKKGRKSKVREMTPQEKSKWEFYRKFSDHSQSEVPNDEVLEIDEDNKHLTSSPRTVFSRGLPKDQVKEEIINYNKKRNAAINDADWTPVIQNFIIDNQEEALKANIDMSIMKDFIDPHAKYRDADYYDDIEGDSLDMWVKNSYRPKERRKAEARNRSLLTKQLRFS